MTATTYTLRIDKNEVVYELRFTTAAALMTAVQNQCTTEAHNQTKALMMLDHPARKTRTKMKEMK